MLLIHQSDLLPLKPRDRRLAARYTLNYMGLILTRAEWTLT